MTHPHDEQVREFWDRVADDWRIQVGDDGDANRRLNSDPVLWALAGDIAGRSVLDAGCGTGYLSQKLAEKGAIVTGIDVSERMIAIARDCYSRIDFRIDSCAELKTCENEQFDLVVSNYVLMDVPDLQRTLGAFHRVLKTSGIAVLIFSHPCFPQGTARPVENGGGVQYVWPTSYFEARQCVDPPWAHFKSEFIWFHRPLSDYWKAYIEAGFTVTDFEEPRVTPERYDLAEDAHALKNAQHRPYSVAFRLQKR